MVDLLLGGSPCQGFSFAGKQAGFADSRSGLFFDYVKALKILKPKYFLFENVKMKKEYQRVITQQLGVEPVEINSALLSAQNRRRLYWTNISNIEQPDDKGIRLKDIVLDDVLLKTDLIHSDKAIKFMDRPVKGGRTHWDFMYHSDIRRPKSSAVIANFSKGIPFNVLIDLDCVRKFHPIECERLQTLPDNYTLGISATQRYKTVGNGWTVDVVAHILSFIPETYLHTVVSLFDGISCGQVALERAGKICEQYYAAEIDKYAVQITKKNYPHTINFGDVTKIDWDMFLRRGTRVNEYQLC